MIAYPPHQVFKHPKVDPTSIDGLHGKVADRWIRTEAYTTGGMFSYYQNVLYPRKGHPYPEAIYANNIVKRFFLTLVMPLADPLLILPALTLLLIPWKYKMRLLERQLIHFTRFASYILQPHILEKHFYNNCSREVWDFTTCFLQGLGVRPVVAESTAEIIATLLEYDDAYRYRFEDVMTELNKADVLKHPRKSLQVFIQVICQRDQIGETTAAGKFISIAKILSTILFIPKINRAFKHAVEESHFENFQLDDIDRFYCLNRIDYKYFGYEITERLIKYVEGKTLKY